MALLTMPFTTLTLVEHASGGAILSHAGSYVAGTYVSPAIVQAFAAATSVLSSVGGGVAATASNPLVLGTVSVAVASFGAYCYFYGIPAPLVAALSKAGLGIVAKQGFAISLPKLAIALVLLGGAGYVSYRFYQHYKLARSHADRVVDMAAGRVTSEAMFGKGAWESFGEAMSLGLDEAVQRAAHAARDAIDGLVSASGSLAKVTTWSGRAAYAGASRIASTASGDISRLMLGLRRILKRN